jgi:hypothetical protein
MKTLSLQKDGEYILLIRHGEGVHAIKREPFSREKVLSLSVTEARKLLEQYSIVSGDSNTFFK